HRRGTHGLPQPVLHRLGGEEFWPLLQREAVLGAQRQQDGVVTGRSLQLEVEGNAESLAEGEPESAVQPDPKGRVPQELHPAGVVKEPLEDDSSSGGKDSKRAQACTEVADDGVRCGPVDPALRLEPDPSTVPVIAFQPLADLSPKSGYFCGELLRAAWGLAEPERHRRRRSVRVDHSDGPRLNTADPPRRCSQQEDVAGPAPNGPIP